MKRILHFENRRLWAGRYLQVLLMVMCAIAALGAFFVVAFSQTDMQAPGVFAYYNAFAQLSFPMVGSCLAFYYGKDYSNGSLAFCEQIDMSEQQIVLSRVLIFEGYLGMISAILLCPFLMADGNGETPIALYALMSVFLMLTVCNLSAATIGVALRDSLKAIVSTFLLFGAMSLVNYFCYGLGSQADSSSLTSFAVGEYLGMPTSNAPQIASAGLGNLATVLGPLVSVVWCILMYVLLHAMLSHRTIAHCE
ncbi:MAG: hypothetical protein PUD09_06770 [Coriobacteriales bacterium]|nr:hypothetical protein [Coriobacteriales bacterium]